jgi:hypothetical protein
MSHTIHEVVVSDTTIRNYDFPFDFIKPEDITVSHNGVVTPYGESSTSFTILNGSTVVLGAEVALDTSTPLYITRRTEDTVRAVDFQAGAMLTEADLDTSAKQAFFLAAEARDVADDAMGVDTVTTTWDAKNKALTGLASSGESDAAMTVGYVEEKYPTIASVGDSIDAVNDVFNNMATIVETARREGGASLTAPTSPLKGDLWFDLNTDVQKVWNGTQWISNFIDTKRYFIKVGTADTEFGTGYDGVSDVTFPVVHDVGYVDVYLNGIHLEPPSSSFAHAYTETATSITLSNPASANSTLIIVAQKITSSAGVGGAVLGTEWVDERDSYKKWLDNFMTRYPLWSTGSYNTQGWLNSNPHPTTGAIPTLWDMATNWGTEVNRWELRKQTNFTYANALNCRFSSFLADGAKHRAVMNYVDGDITYTNSLDYFFDPTDTTQYGDAYSEQNHVEYSKSLWEHEFTPPANATRMTVSLRGGGGHAGFDTLGGDGGITVSHLPVDPNHTYKVALGSGGGYWHVSQGGMSPHFKVVQPNISYDTNSTDPVSGASSARSDTYKVWSDALTGNARHGETTRLYKKLVGSSDWVEITEASASGGRNVQMYSQGVYNSGDVAGTESLPLAIGEDLHQTKSKFDGENKGVGGTSFPTQGVSLLLRERPFGTYTSTLAMGGIGACGITWY